MEKTIHLDRADRALLQALQQPVALAMADLAEQLGLSQTSCWRRIKRLEQAGVLEAPRRLVDPERIGLSVNVMCNVRLKGHSAEARSRFDDFVKRHPEVMECYSMSGEWDYVLRVVVRDVAAYEKFLMEDLLNQDAVATASSSFALKQLKYTTALPVE